MTDDKPTVLFLCTHNAGRSQMALGYFNHLAGEQAVAWSGGSEPGDQINPSAVAAMAEVGIDITGSSPSPGPTRCPSRRRHHHHGMWRCLPVFPGKRYEDWVLPDPAGQSVEPSDPIRDEIEQRVRAFCATWASTQGGDLNGYRRRVWLPIDSLRRIGPS